MTVLLADPEIAAVPVIECGEPLVPVPSAVAWEGDRPLVRSGVAARLAVAQLLLPPGRRLLVVDGHRSPLEQAAIWERYLADVRRARPRAAEPELRRLTSRFVAPLEVAPHVAGAAVDLTLIDRRGRRVEMGCALDATPEQSGGACWFDADVPAPARAERDLLARAMRGAGFVNYPTEWWHWSHGDRYWAWTARTAAVYGPIAVGAAAARIPVAAGR